MRSRQGCWSTAARAQRSGSAWTGHAATSGSGGTAPATCAGSTPPRSSPGRPRRDRWDVAVSAPVTRAGVGTAGVVTVTVAATDDWLDPDLLRFPAGEVHAWLRGRN